MVTTFCCYCADGRGALQSSNLWGSCNVQGKIREREMEDGKDMVMEGEGAWNLGRMGMLSGMRAGIGMWACVLVLVVVVVLAVMLVWMLLMVVAGVLAVVVATVMMQGVLLEDDCVGMVSGSTSGGFVVVVAVEGFGRVLLSSCRMALGC